MCVCLCAPPLLPGPESSTQLSSECALRPHIVPRFCEDASQSIFECFVREKGNMCHRGGRSLPKVHSTTSTTPHPPPLSWQGPELPSNKRETRGGAKAGSTVSLICQEGRCQGSTASVVHYYWRGLSDGGRLMAEQGAS